VRVDAVRLRQVLINLGGNAVKFTESGEVTFRVVPVGPLAATAESLRVRFEVADTGIGIAPENQGKVFEQFAQEDASTTRRFGGSGLGLAISRQIVELMGGQLSLVSTPGAGSTFSFEVLLPLAPRTAVAPPPAARLDGVRVLVADDNAAARVLIVNALRAWGARPTEVASLEAALVELRSAAYEAVIVDDPLPDGAALTLLQQLQAAPSVRPRVVRLVGFANLTPVSGRADRGFDAEVTKPLRLKELQQALIGRGAALAHVGPAGPGPSRLAPLSGRVLVVEDQPLNREVAIGMLAALGLAADTANDGREALQELARTHYDAVLMDCEMPVMDGLAATRELRRTAGSGPHLPVIALTADATSEARAACVNAGMDDYLTKPFTREALHATLARWLAGAPAAAAGSVAPRAQTAPDPATDPGAELLLDRATLAALRALPARGSLDMLSHIATGYLADSQDMMARIERAVHNRDAAELARAAHAWRSCNGHVGALGLVRLCRELEKCGRAGELAGAPELLAQLRALYPRVREELDEEIRKSA
jgi:CheY-like chemotaxis protein/HPt (histidine-containing phosphotransfer) domain-containing protein